MTLSEILDMTVRMAKKYGGVTDSEEVKGVLTASLRDVHIDVGGPIRIWVSTADKEEDENPVEFPSTDSAKCVEVKEVFLDGVKLYKHHLNKLTEIINDEVVASS